MEKKLSKEEVEHIAKLIKIYISDNELEKYRSQLNTVLDYLKVFSELDTDNTEITSQVTGLVNVLREDEPHESLSQEEALLNSENNKDGYFVVKKVL